jgi:uncharacterized protein
VSTPPPASLPAAGRFPGRAALEGYGRGGFRFAGMSHQGALLILPSAILAWRPAALAEANEDDIAPLLAEAADIELLLIGTGRDIASLPPRLAGLLRGAGLRLDTMTTAAAARTYNVLSAENRKVAAALIAVP